MAKQDKFQIEEILGPTIQPTLVKFNSPVMAGRADNIGKFPSGPPSKKGKLANFGACQDSSLMKKEAEEIFNNIIPSREWTVDGNIWRQTVSSTPATRGDVITLEEQLSARLKQGNAQVTGICSIRRELYAQCFDEIIRQVTINCTERGLLLLRVRDETNITLNAYRAIYESAAAYAMRKTLRSLSNRSALELNFEKVNNEKDNVQQTVEELQAKYDELAIKFEDQERTEEKRHYEEAQIHRQSNEQLKVFLEESIAPVTNAKKAAAIAAAAAATVTTAPILTTITTVPEVVKTVHEMVNIVGNTTTEVNHVVHETTNSISDPDPTTSAVVES